MASLEIRERFVASTLVARELLRNADLCTPPKPLSTLQIVELTYLAHGWSFVNLEAPLVSDDVYAWKHGPVYPELYDMIRSFGNDPVTKIPASPREQGADTELAEREKSFVKAVYNRYRELSGYDLMKLTGEAGTPWHATWRFSQDGVIIGNDLIRDYYVTKARRESNA